MTKKSSIDTEDIAVIGLGCRLPGGVESPADYWRLMKTGHCAITKQTRFAFEDEAASVQQGGFLDQVDHFDASFFEISPKEAATLDPQQRLLMEVSWEALEHAGLAPETLRDSDTGVFVGIFSNDYQHLQVKQNDDPDIFSIIGTSAATASGRLSYFYGFQGPTMSIDTASSSSLVAFHLACQHIKYGECEVALACGVNLILDPNMTVAYARAGMLSPEGRSKGFDASADGFVRGEGCGVTVLKHLSAAIRDGDNILAIVRGTAINQDGASQGLTAPSEASQVAVLKKALDAARLQPADVFYVEAHGSGTPIGDPIEGNALQAVYGAGRTTPWVIGSAKTNIGHLEAAAGIAGVIKAVLVLQHGYIPPHLHFEELNPRLSALQATIPKTGLTWERNGLARRSGVSSFGLSGTNAHAILEEAPDSPRPRDEPATERPFQLVPLSAKSEPALDELARRYVRYLAAETDVSLADLSYTASTGRADFEHRLAAVTESPAELRAQLQAFTEGVSTVGLVSGKASPRRKPKTAFLFTGSGSQYVDMGRELFETAPPFRQIVSSCDEILRPHLDIPLLDVLYPQEGERSPIDEMTYLQPAIFVIDYALAKLWQSWGVEPDILIGHSLGELVAACLSGVFELEDGLALIALRGRLMAATADGEMVSLKASEEEVRRVVEPDCDEVSIAAVNASRHTVISGRPEPIARVLARMPGVKATRLNISCACHSPTMTPIMDEFEDGFRDVSLSQPEIPLVSNVLGELVDESTLSPAYWRRHLREPVRFGDGMEVLHRQGVDVFVEMGPKPILLGVGRDTLTDYDVDSDEKLWLPSLRPEFSDWQSMLESLADVYVHGVGVDWKALAGDSPCRRLALPTYPFQRQRHWTASSMARVAQASPSTRFGRDSWRERLAIANDPAIRFAFDLGQELPPYLKHHRIFGKAILPAGIYFEIGLSSAKEIFNTVRLSLKNLVLQQPLILPDDPQAVRTTQAVLTSEEEGRLGFQFYSVPDGMAHEPVWIPHAVGHIHLCEEEETPEPRLAALRRRCAEAVSVEEHYHQTGRQHMVYRWPDGAGDGPHYHVLRELWRGREEGEALGRIHLPTSLYTEAETFGLHSLLIEGGIQVARATFPNVELDTDETYLPVGVDQFHLFRAVVGDIWAYARLQAESQDEVFKATVLLLDEEGPIAKMLGLSFKKTTRAALLRPAVQGAQAARQAKRVDLAEQLSRAKGSRRQILMSDYLQNQTRQVLGLRPSQPLATDSSLKELGMGSLMSTDLKNRFERDLKVTIPMERLMQPGCHLDNLTEILLEKLEPSLSGTAVSDEAVEDGGDFQAASHEIPQIHAVVTEQVGRQLKVEGHWVSDFASCNYLGLDLHQGVIDSILPAVEKWGVHPSWTRAVASPGIYEDLEEALARLMGSYSVLVFPAVTLLHAGVIPVLAGYDGVIFKDISAHRSIDEGSRLAQTNGAEVVVFQHNDPVDLEERLSKYPVDRTKIIAIDGVYSMSGAYAALPEFSRLAKQYNATVYMDDAHGLGVIGEQPTGDMPYGFRGNGIVKHFGLDYEEDRMIYVAGLSKSYSSFGAFITCTDEAIKDKFRTASTFIFSGPSPIASLASALAGLRLNDVEGEEWRGQVYRLTYKLVTEAKGLGFEVVNDNYFPIVGVVIGETEKVIEACKILWKYGVLITPALFPIVPQNKGLLRFSITAANTEEEITRALESLQAVRERIL